MLTRDRTKSQERDFEVIDIQFNGKDYLPTYDSRTIDLEPYDFKNSTIDSLEIQYLDMYQPQRYEGEEYQDYEVQSDDTLQGLELKFGVPQQRILKINGISEAAIVKGMKIKLPITLNNVLEKSESTEMVYDNPVIRKKSSSFLGINLMDEIMQKSQSKKLYVHYITDTGNIHGILTINEDMIFFDPVFEEGVNSPMKYQASIRLIDVLDAKAVALPTRLTTYGNESKSDQVLEVNLVKIGKKDFEKKYHHKLEEMRGKKQPVGRVFFRIDKGDAEEVAQYINSLLTNKSMQKSDDLGMELLTYLPYFDLNEDIIQVMERTNKIWNASNVIPHMVDKSEIVTQDQFIQIVQHMPSVFKVGDWKLLYSNNKHGSLLSTLLRQVQEVSPLIMIVRDLDKWVFGAYLSDTLRYSTNFYGSGETFLFTFHDTSTITTYKWSQQNQDFVLSDHDGLAVGCGDKYGLYLKEDLSEGYSQFCSTFMNDSLTKHGSFVVDVIEVWGMDLI